MKELLSTLEDWQRDGVAVGRAVVLRTYGSAPRLPGSNLLYTEDGRIAGSVSGGCVEGAAAHEIDEARRSGMSKVVHYGISNEVAWGVGLACGGTLDVLVEPEVPQEVASAAAGSTGTVIITPLPATDEGAPPAARLVYDASNGLRGTTADAQADQELVGVARDALLRGTSRTVDVAGHEYFLEAFPVPPRLVIVGAVEIARALVTLARELGFTTVVVDGRPAFASRERFPDADELVIGWPDEEADSIGLGPDDAVVVLSHDPKFDDPALREALRRGCRYVGAIGSRKTQQDRREHLRAAGVPDEDLERIHGPIGLDLGGRAPAETALAILAEVVAARYTASGKPLSRAPGGGS
ncbi:MAG TPA: XdhC/CoxI family protein [Candidatus Limnocylindrales bacterium]